MSHLQSGKFVCTYIHQNTNHYEIEMFRICDMNSSACFAES